MMVTMLDGGIADYLAEMRVAGLSDATIRTRRYQLGAWRRWLADHGTPVAAVTRPTIIRFLHDIEDPETRGSYCSAIRCLYRWRVQVGLAADSPAASLPRIHRPVPDPKPLPDAVFADALLRATRREQDMLILGRFAGMRAAEIADCRREHLSGQPGRETIHIVGKGAKPRTIPAHPEVVRVTADVEGWMFPSWRRPGQPVQGGCVSGMLSALLGPGWSAHCLRHAFATESYARTRDLLLVQRWLGHSSAETTRRYIRVQPDDFDAIRTLHLVA